MSNLNCPNCGHMIGTLQQESTPDTLLDKRIKAWAERLDWSGAPLSGDLYKAYLHATGDEATSHRRWSASMQRVGYAKGRGANGVRVFRRE